jgi:hypothetical protein
MAPFIRIEYQWREGTVPPPHYYEYAVSVAGDGMAEIGLTPDYPQDHPPVFRAMFRVAPSAIQRVDEVLAEADETVWMPLPTERAASLGDSTERLTLFGGAGVAMFSTTFSSDDKARLATLREAVRGMVPADVWQRLQRRRAQYWRERGVPIEEPQAS